MRKLILGAVLVVLVALPGTVLTREERTSPAPAGAARSESAGKVLRSSLGRGIEPTTPTGKVTSATGVRGADPARSQNSAGHGFGLQPGHPNPFNPTTTIVYRLSQATRVDVSVYDISGRLVRILARGWGEADVAYQVVWDGTSDAGHSLPSGIYLLRMLTETSAQTGKLVLLK